MKVSMISKLILSTVLMSASVSWAADSTMASRSIEKVGVGLLKGAKADENGNKFVSPISLQIVMAILAEGADGQTLNELSSALGVSKSELKNLAASEMDLFGKIHNAIESSNSKEDNEGNKISNFGLSLRNAIFKNADLNLKSSYQSSLKSSYRPQVKNVDFQNETSQAVDTINL